MRNQQVGLENKKVNIGCGQTPTLGWFNCDNSFSVKIAQLPFSNLIVFLLKKLSLLGKNQEDFVNMAKKCGIQVVNATRKLPFADESVEALYASHMFEYLKPWEAEHFLREVLRALGKGGIIRLAVPDLKKMVNDYLIDGNGDKFIRRTLFVDVERPFFSDKLKNLFFNQRNHCWIYDEQSLIRLLLKNGFQEPRALAPNQTTIKNPGNLNLAERIEESLYVEARK